MSRKREQFERWLEEWKEHFWSCRDVREWSRLQFTDTDVRDHVRQVLGTHEVAGLVRLAALAKGLDLQRRRLVRCKVFLGRELIILRNARGTWAEIADWTMISDKTLRILVKTFRHGPAPNPSGFDRQLTALADRVSSNPFRRICEFGVASYFHSCVAKELQAFADLICTELDNSGVARSQIADHADVNLVTLANWIDRAKRP